MDLDKKTKSGIDSELLKIAAEELNENPETRDKDIETFRSKVKAHYKLESIDVSDSFLLRFLRARLFDQDAALELLVNYNNFFETYKQELGDLTVDSIKEFIDENVQFALSGRDLDGCRILYFRPGKWDPQRFTSWDILKILMLNLEALLQDEDVQIRGLNLLECGMNANASLTVKLPLAYMKAYSEYLAHRVPIRLKSYHGTDLNVLLKILNPFEKWMLPPEIHLVKTAHAHHSELLKCYSRDDIPDEVGGQVPVEDAAKEWKKVLLQTKFPEPVIKIKSNNNKAEEEKGNSQK